MKIAMIGHKRIPSREGGVEIVVEELSTRLVKKGHIVDVYNRKGKNVLDKNIKVEKIKNYKGVNIKEVFTFQNKSLNAIVYTILATMRAIFGHYDVIHFHAEGPCSMIWLPHLFKIKTIATIHGLDWQRAKWGGFATKYLKFGEKMAVKYADEIIVLSSGVQKYFKETYGRNTTFIPNGVNRPQLKEAKKIKEKWGLEKDSYILYLARIVPEKGLHYLMDAFKEIDTDKKLVIAGGSSHTNDYFEEIKRNSKEDSRVIMTGFVQGDILDELYSNCYLYCLPSDIEGMPISLMEAMSYGCNVLTSDIEECLQVTGKYGYTFEAKNVQSLRKSLEKSLTGMDRKNNEEISEYVLQKYCWDNIIEETERLYNKSRRKR